MGFILFDSNLESTKGAPKQLQPAFSFRELMALKQCSSFGLADRVHRFDDTRTATFRGRS